MVNTVSKRRSEDIEEDIERLHDWLLKQPHLPHDVEKVLLAAFVHGTKTLEMAKKKLDGYFSIRNRHPKIYDFKARDTSTQSFKYLSSCVDLFFLPKTTPEGYRVLGMVIKDNIEEVFDHQFLTNRVFMMGELGLNYWPESTSMLLFVDAKKVPASMVTRLSPTVLAASVGCYLDGFPIKFKGLFLFNTKPFIEMLMNTLLKPIAPKIYSRMIFTAEDESSLKETIPEELLPSNYGGKEKSSAELNDIWMNIMVEKRDWFKKGCEQTADENKRPPDCNNTYGIEGTFRKLSVD